MLPVWIIRWRLTPFWGTSGLFCSFLHGFSFSLVFFLLIFGQFKIFCLLVFGRFQCVFAFFLGDSSVVCSLFWVVSVRFIWCFRAIPVFLLVFGMF